MPTLNLAAVVVLYRTQPDQSASVVSLQRAAAAAHTAVTLHILLYDNTPGDQRPSPLPAGVFYVASPCNRGLAGAYNRAILFAQERDCEWLLTLDQDTDLSEDFLLCMARRIAEVEQTPEVAAIVPQILGGDRILSPYRFFAGAVPSWFPAAFQGIPNLPVFAFNSASLVRLSALRQVGGYQPWFWLDSSDANLFSQLHQVGKRVLVAGEIQVHHDFSMKDRQNSVSPARYRNILLAESALWDLRMSFLAGCERTARLILRMVQHMRRNDPPALRRITLQFLKRRLFWSRTRRFQAWRQETLNLFPDLASVPLPAPRNAFPTPLEPSIRPRVSVVMAAYNGAPYIEQQIRSILHQLAPQDELVIVDDASTDHTVDVIRTLQSPAIHLIQRAANQGVVATFEQALRNATGEILFLADGDDIWNDRKVELFLEAFRTDPPASIVTSQVAFIDQQGAPMHDTMFNNRKSFHAGFWHNLLRNHFQGSAMAFRASLLGSVLPFPQGMGFLHDQWIGMRNAAIGGRAVMLRQPLLFYRRHPHNFSRRMSRSRQLTARLQLLAAHLAAAVRDHF